MKEFLLKIRKELEKENEKIINHPLIKEAEEGKLKFEKIKNFVSQQIYIVNHDLRSLAIMLSRSKYNDEVEFFYTLISGDYEALKRLKLLAEEIKVDFSEPIPMAIAYTHYLAWLANYANPGEQATALVINLPVWGEACKKFGKALKEKYGIKNIGFFELFSGPFDKIEEMAIKIMERYKDNLSNMEKCAKLIQSYELMFWNGIYQW
ncbi:MAG: TenA family transcriptional regulator [Candidatus Verstraetearchaeota archaeon]|jgi:thiaminase|nr:TenA family transcriptional regulator [Candidatus Verstraetearchaeota archaeon]